MKIRAILRFRNEDLTRKRLIAGFKTQKELADFIGINQQNISHWETLKSYPKKKSIIEALEKALNCKMEEIFPEEIIRAIHKKIGAPIEQVIDVKRLPPFMRGEYLLESPEKIYEAKERGEIIEKTMNEVLTPKQKLVLTLRFRKDKSLYEVGEELKLSPERIRQIESKALRKLRYPGRLEELI